MELLLEVVRLAPNAADPYRTLGNIYEVKGDPRKALHFFMIAAHLPPKVPSRFIMADLRKASSTLRAC